MLPIGFPFKVTSLLKSAYFLLEVDFLLSDVDIILWISSGRTALVDVEFTNSADSESGSYLA